MVKFKEGQVLYWRDKGIHYHSSGSFILKVINIKSDGYECRILFKSNLNSKLFTLSSRFSINHKYIGFAFNSLVDDEAIVLDGDIDYRLQAVMLEL